MKSPIMSFNLDFIQRTLKTTGVLLVIMFLIGTYYFGFYDALAVFSAGVWSMVNLIFLSALVRAAVRPDGINKTSVAGLALIKFPLLYAAGYFLIITKVFRPIPLVIGFSMVLVVIALKAMSRAILKLDDDAVHQENDVRGRA